MEEKLRKLFADYQELPEYLDRTLTDVNQISAFGDRPVHIAAVRGSVYELNLLYENGADINVAGEYDFSPLLYAAEQGHIDAVRWLVEKGADRTAKNINGNNAIDLARILNHKEVQSFLESLQ